MASPVIKIKRSSVQNNAPSAAQLELGELALNTYDGKLFTEINDGTVSIVEIGGHLNHLAATGISTFGSDKVVVGAAQTQFLVRGNARVVGVLTVGSGSVTLNDDSVNVGAGTTILTTGFQVGGNGVFVHSTGYNVGDTFVHNAGITGAGANLSGIVTAVGLDINGNIDVSGTVDGRDLASDGSKLDGIESGATADQTASDIKTLLNSSGIVNAQIDGSAAIAGSKISPTFTSDLTVEHSGHPTILIHDTSGDNQSRIQFQTDSYSWVAGLHGGENRWKVSNSSAFGTNDYLELDTSGNLYVGNNITANNIIVSGNVDGRDVATDGSKLDGIEAGATADQSNSEIKTAYEANSNTNAFTDALLSKLNGIEASATADQTASEIVSLIANQTIAPSTIDMEDDEKIKLGNSDDLEIYHDSNNSYVQDTGTGNLVLKGTHVVIQNGGSNKSGAIFRNDGAAELYHGISGSESSAQLKIATTTTGVSVTGNIVVSGNVDGVDIATRDTLFGGLTSSSGVLTNGVVGTTQTAGDNSTKIATTAYTDTAINNLINGAPAALDTLNELAAAMADDAAFSTTVTNSLATKMPLAGGEFTGNVTFSGSQTVDGRDLSVDGAKLDGIEAGATGDQTNAEIRAAVEAASDSNVFTDADHSKLNGIESGATADQTATEILNSIKTVDGTGSGLYADFSNSLVIKDTRNEGARVPNDYAAHKVTSEFTNQIINGWWSTLTVKGWANGYAPWQLVGKSDTGQNTNLYVRFGHGQNNTWSNLFNIWHSGNDGSGSNLDADLLDGQQGSYYLDYNNFSNTPTIPTNNNQLTNGAGYVTANTQLSNEQVQDIVGAMVSSNTESGITVTYQDSDGTIDFAVASQTDENFTTADHSKLDGIEAGADVTDATNVNAAGAVMNSDSTTASMSFVVDEDDMSSDSSTKVPTQQSVKAYVDSEVSGLVDSAPGALNTLNELAAAINDDASFSTTITNSIAAKLPLGGGTMTGNIVMSGSQTVDGRDLSVDGSKLDGIEAGATADQTASEILALIKTVDGAGSGLDADTLDGVAGSSYLTTANYDTHVCHLKSNANTALVQGASNEFTVNFNLEEHNDSSAFSHSSGVVTVLSTGWYRVYANMVYENSSSSSRNTIRAYVKKNGTEIVSTRTYDYDRGASYGRFSNNKIETMIYLSANDTISICNYAYNEDGNVTIQSEECEFIVNSVSVATTTSNADTVDGLHASSFVRSDATDTVTGALTFTNDATFTGDIYLTDTGTDSSAGPILDFYRNSSSAADADYLGQLKFQGENDAGQKVLYSKITGKILDASDGTEDGILEFAFVKGGSNNISGRFRSDSLQLLNGTNFSVAGDSTLTGGLDVDGHTEVDNLKSVGIATFSNNAIHANVYSTGISTISGFRFPTSDGDEDQALVTDGNGSLSFKTLSGGGSAAGAATTISTGITTATQGQTVFSTPHPHNDGTNTYSTQVFVNGVKQRPQGAGNATKDYTTSSNSTVTFEEGLPVGAEVVSVVYFGHTIDEEYFTATQGQVLFPLSGSLSAQKNFRVFVNGIKQRVGSDFGVAAPVTLVVPCAEGAHVEIVCDNAEDAFIATDQQTNFTPTSTDITEDNMQVYVNGIQLFSGIDYSIGSPSVTFTDASGLTVGDEVDVCIRRTA